MIIQPSKAKGFRGPTLPQFAKKIHSIYIEEPWVHRDLYAVFSRFQCFANIEIPHRNTLGIRIYRVIYLRPKNGTIAIVFPTRDSILSEHEKVAIYYADIPNVSVVESILRNAIVLMEIHMAIMKGRRIVRGFLFGNKGDQR